MLKLTPAPTFVHPVELTLPGKGKVPVAIEFRHKGRRELNAWIAKSTQLAADDPAAEADWMAEVVAGWPGVLGDDGEPHPFSVTHLQTLLNTYPGSGRELFDGYLQAYNVAVAKNSVR